MSDAIADQAQGSSESVAMNTTDIDEIQSPYAEVEMSEAELEDVKNWIDEEVRRAEADRSDYDASIIAWRDLYDANPESEIKNFPWENASNIVVPVVATAVDAVLARLVNSVFGAKRIWLAKAKSPKWREAADPITKFLDYVQENVLKFYRSFRRWMLSVLKIGTGVGKLTWEKKWRKIVYMSNGTRTEEIVLTHDGPRFHTILPENFLFSSDLLHTGNIQECSWVGERADYTWKDLKEMELSSIFKDVDRIKETKATTPTEAQSRAEQVTGVVPSERSTYRIYEIWFSWPVDDNGTLAEFVMNIELETKTVLRFVYNFFRHQERPYHMLVYQPREDSPLGIGLAEMLADVQEEVTTIHNQRIDNATIANTKVFKRRRQATVVDEEIYPGAFLTVDEPDDIMEMDLGTEHSTLLQEELHSNSIGERRTGVSDYTVGRESSAIGSRATATSTMALIREGNKRFQMVIRDIKDVLSDLAHQLLMLYQQFAPDRTIMYEMMSEEDAQIVKKYFTLPPEHTRASVQLDVDALSETNNKELQQQTMLQLMGIVQQFYTGLFEAMQVAVQPEAPQQLRALAIQGAETGSSIFERLLEAMDIQDADYLTPDIQAILNGQGMMDNSAPPLGMGVGGLDGQPTLQAGGPAATSQPGQVPAMAASGAGAEELLGFGVGALGE